MSFNSILSSTTEASLTIPSALLCTLVSVILGLLISFVYMIRSEYSKNFVITLALLPAIVQVVIMLVNGNLGTAVATVGAFSLVRFRSVPGTSKEITCIFLAMAVGLATGTGYLTFAIVFTILVCIILLVLNLLPFGVKKTAAQQKELKVTIPENLDYASIYDDLFEEHLSSVELTRVKTSNMGSMYELTYLVTFKDVATEKKLIDDMRCRNGNLPIVCSMLQTPIREEL